MKKNILILLTLCLTVALSAQADRWQQRALYQMDINMDVETHKLQGTQRLVYFNNSPDDLNRVFYHLYFNAFQPNSMMDARNQWLSDSDGRVNDRISKLSESESGFTKVKSLSMNGKPVKFEHAETILEVTLNEPIAPNSQAVFEMEFHSQVPVQIRRNGRDNAEGISYSMAQWYPKMCEYDYQGWHANPYVGREFYGIYGEFDVKITIDKDYIIGGTGYLQNPEKIGFGYTKKQKGKRTRGKTRTWHFIAPNVHDFAWGADPDYHHDKLVRKDGTVLHFFYQKGEETTDNWEKLPAVMDAAFDYINENYGQYPYKQYSFIQGGDGGMEYPMATLITGQRRFGSLVGVSVHELMHSWYQGVLGTNEALYAWMDEGFTSWTSTEIMNHLKSKGFLKGEFSDQPHAGTYTGYRNYFKSGKAEPMSTHADHFSTNYAYWLTAYTGGQTFLEQLQYIIGEEAHDRLMLRYYKDWQFKHPNPKDFIRIAEYESGMELDWYLEYFINSTKVVDYGIKNLEKDGKRTIITLERSGQFPMPIDLEVTMSNGAKKNYTIPLGLMRGEKSSENGVNFITAKDWYWTHTTYDLSVEGDVESVQIDPTGRLADFNLDNNAKGFNEAEEIKD